MISKVDGSPPKSLGDLELKQSDPRKNHKKATALSNSETITSAEEPELSTLPTRIRYLGNNLDLVG